MVKHTHVLHMAHLGSCTTNASSKPQGCCKDPGYKSGKLGTYRDVKCNYPGKRQQTAWRGGKKILHFNYDDYGEVHDVVMMMMMMMTMVRFMML